MYDQTQAQISALLEEVQFLKQRCQSYEYKLDRVCTTIDQASELIQGDIPKAFNHSNVAIGATMLDMLSMQIEEFMQG